MKCVKRSVELLRKVVRNKLDQSLPLLVNFSGGKDSLTCLLLALEVSDNVECCFMDGGQELPGTLEYVLDRCKEFGVKLHISHPVRDRIPHKVIPKHICLLPQYIKYFGYFPTTVRRYCSIWLKLRPLRIYLRKRFGRASLFKISGIRLSESSIRKWKYGSEKACNRYGGKYIRPDREHSGSFLVMPILDWTEKQIVQFLKKRSVEIHEGYKIFGTSGCKWCPVMNPETAKLILQAYPRIYDDLIDAEAAINKPAWLHKKIWLRDLLSG